MDITFYLVELLRLHDCVIVPDLGGFVTNYRPAVMDIANGSFNPPVKEVIFTGKLNKNDGLLVNYISGTEGVGYFEARQIISEFVDEVWSKLENGEKIIFQNIGTLQFDRNEKLIFESQVHENFLLDTYGMEGFQFPQLEHKEILLNKRVFADKEAVRPVFGSRKVKALVVGIPILLALIFIPVSRYSWKVNPNMQVSSTASIPVSILGNQPASTESQREIIDEVKPKIDSVSVQPVIKNEPAQPVTVQTDRGRYRIIGGCFKSRQNADNYLQRLQSNGFKSELKIQPNGSFLVIVQTYSDKNQATAALRSLREAEPTAGYWISAN